MLIGFGGIALTSMRSSGVCGVVDFVGISLPRWLGSAPRLLDRVRLLLRLGNSDRSLGTFGAGVPWNFLSGLGVWCICVLPAYFYPNNFAQMYRHVRMLYGAFGPQCCMMQFHSNLITPCSSYSVCFYLMFLVFRCSSWSFPNRSCIIVRIL